MDGEGRLRGALERPQRGKDELHSFQDFLVLEFTFQHVKSGCLETAGVAGSAEDEGEARLLLRPLIKGGPWVV